MKKAKKAAIGDTGQLVKVAGSNHNVCGGIILKSEYPPGTTPQRPDRGPREHRVRRRRGGEESDNETRQW